MTKCPKCGSRMRKAWADKPMNVTEQEFRSTGYHWVCSNRECGIARTQSEMA